MADSHQQADREAANRCRDMHARDTLTDLLGFSLDDARAGYAKVTGRVRDDMLNMHGGCHGGIIYTIADSAFGYACNSRGTASLAQFNVITYLAPAKAGDMLVAEAVERSVVGKTGTFDVTVSIADGAVIAEMRGTARIRPQKG